MAIHPYDTAEGTEEELQEMWDNMNEPADSPVRVANSDERYSWFEAHRQSFLQAVREDRNQRLIESDWIVTKSSESGVDVPADWVTYRQALRDITATYEKLDDIQDADAWPSAPDGTY